MEREKLRNVLNATVSSHGGDVFYYQGLHDITSVLLFTGGERLALVMMRRLVTCHLRDCTRCAAAAGVYSGLAAGLRTAIDSTNCSFDPLPGEMMGGNYECKQAMLKRCLPLIISRELHLCHCKGGALH